MLPDISLYQLYCLSSAVPWRALCSYEQAFLHLPFSLASSYFYQVHTLWTEDLHTPPCHAAAPFASHT